MKLLLFFAFTFAVFTFISAIIEKQGLGFAATSLTSDLSETGLTINVINTEGFLDSDYVIIDSEYIYYSSKNAAQLIVPATGRGWKNTNPSSHSAVNNKGVRTAVRNNEASLMNTLAGYNISEVMSLTGIFSVPTAIIAYFDVFVNILAWNYSMLDNIVGQFIKYILLYPLSGAFVGFIIMAIIGAAQSIINR